jgi:hypothetical protein
VPVRIQQCAERCSEIDWSKGEAPHFTDTLQNSGASLHSLFWEVELNGLREAAIGAPTFRPRPDLYLHFMGTLDTLDTPFEILQGNEDAPFAAVHPFSRSTIDAIAEIPPFSPMTIVDLARRRQKLRVLVAAGRSERYGAAIKNEVVRIREILDRALPGTVEVVSMFSEGTTRNSLASALEQEWHIVHLAGHGTLDADGQCCGFSVQAERPTKTDSDWVHPDELADWLRRCGARFAYLSCCFGFELFARKLITTGVPALLAFRGQFRGERYLDFATTFYSSLHADWDLPTTTLLARNQAYRTGNPLWAASVLHVAASTRV